MMKPEIVRAELLQIEVPLYLVTDFGYWKNEPEECDSKTNAKQVFNNKDILNFLPDVSSTTTAVRSKDEKKEHCIFLLLAEMAAPRENSKDSIQNIVPSLESSSESMPGSLKHQDYDNSEASWEEDFKGIHEDGLHLPQNLWNDPDIKPENAHSNSLEQDSKDMPEETENETNVNREVKELSEITKDCSLSSDIKESSALKIHQRRENSKQKNNEDISQSGSGIFQRKCSVSTQPEDNDCNSIKKSTSEIGIQVGLTEEKSHMKLGTNPASGEHLATSCTEKSKSKRGVSHELPANFVPMDEERKVLKSHNKEMMLNRCVTAPKYDTKKQITVESLENLTAEDESCLNLEIDYLRAQEKNMAQGSEKSMNGFSRETYEKESQFRTDEDHNSKEKPEDISYELNDDTIHDGDKKVLESEQDTINYDNA